MKKHISDLYRILILMMIDRIKLNVVCADKIPGKCYGSGLQFWKILEKCLHGAFVLLKFGKLTI